MSQVFHLDLFLEHLERVEESTQAYRQSAEGEEQRREVNRAYNGILDASDAIGGYRTLLARELLELDARRRDVLALVEADQEALQSDEESDPFRPFWTKPWALLLNIGLFPIRFAGWLSRVKIRRDRDILDKSERHRALKIELAEAMRQGARAEAIRRLQAQVEESRRAVEALLERNSTHRLRRVEDLVEYAIEKKGSEPARDVPPREKAEEIFSRTRQFISRLRDLHSARQSNSIEIDAIDDFVTDLPRASYADVLLKQRARLYDRILVSAGHLLDEIQLCRTLTAILEKARAKMESLFPYAAEKTLSSWIHDPESSDLLDAVRGTLGTLSALSGRTVSPNLEVPAPRRTLPALLAGLARYDRSRSGRLRRWEASGGPSQAKEIAALVGVPVRLAERARWLKEQVVSEFDRTAALMQSLRGHLGTVSYRIANPLHVYRREIDNARFEREFLIGAVNKIFAYTLGLVVARFIALGFALWAVLRNGVHWFAYFTRRGRARRLRAQTEKIVKEFAEELEAMAGGFLLPGETRADHLLLAEGEGRDLRTAEQHRLPVEADVLELLRLYHEIHVSHLTFGTTFLFEGNMSKALLAALVEHEKRIVAQLRRIRLHLESVEESLHREAEFYRKATRVHESASALGDKGKSRLALGLVRLRERLREASLDTTRLGPILEAAMEGSAERRAWLVLRTGYDFPRLAELTWRTIDLFDGRRPLDPDLVRRVERAIDEMAQRDYSHAQGAIEAKR